MRELPRKLQKKMMDREVARSVRKLPEASSLIDFSSNDYLGFSGNREIFDRANIILSEGDNFQNGATGSRLLSGNHPLYSDLEVKLSKFHQTESALVFNSGYDANIGFFGCVPQRGDIVFYDELVHASIRDGINMGNAKSYKFAHNDLDDLLAKLKRMGSYSVKLDDTKAETEAKPEGDLSVLQDLKSSKDSQDTEVYIVTESVFSMDGDSPDLKAFSEFCQHNDYRLVVDEAHSVGVFGINGQGLVQHQNLFSGVFARIITFGKAVGCHGAAVIGNADLTKYLVNFARSLIYTTGLPPHSVATILSSYERLSICSENTQQRNIPLRQLRDNILFFNRHIENLNLLATLGNANKQGNDADRKPYFIPSNSAIHCCIIPGNERATQVGTKLQNSGYDVRPILAPTVPKGLERIRICLHSFNTKKEIGEMLTILSDILSR